MKAWLQLFAILGFSVGFLVAVYAAVAFVYGAFGYVTYRAFCIVQGC